MPRLSADAAQRLVIGQGEYVADLALEGGVEVCFVRSPAAHAALGRVDLRTPRGITAAELGLRPIALEAGGMVPVAWQPLAVDRVRYVGEPVAMVWAEDRYRAEDLADAVTIDYPAAPPGHTDPRAGAGRRAAVAGAGFRRRRRRNWLGRIC